MDTVSSVVYYVYTDNLTIPLAEIRDMDMYAGLMFGSIVAFVILFMLKGVER